MTSIHRDKSTTPWKETKFSWILLQLDQNAAQDPDGMALFTALFQCRNLPGLVVQFVFWGSPTGLPGAKYCQAEAYARAAISVKRSIESLSRLAISTRTEASSADGLSKEDEGRGR